MKRNNIKLARNLRKTQTPQEMKMWARLRNRQFNDLKFRRQCTIGNYIVDFVCLEKKIIIEIDGWQHKNEFSGKKEKNRDAYLEDKRFKVIHFWNNDVDNNIDSVFLKIEEIVDHL